MMPLQPWTFLVVGYLTTVLIETPVLWVGLSPRHAWSRKLFAGFWLTACTYPVVILVLPYWFQGQRWLYVVIAETFAPTAECFLFWLAFVKPSPGSRRDVVRDMTAVVVANLCSFGFGVLMKI